MALIRLGKMLLSGPSFDGDVSVPASADWTTNSRPAPFGSSPPTAKHERRSFKLTSQGKEGLRGLALHYTGWYAQGVMSPSAPLRLAGRSSWP